MMTAKQVSPVESKEDSFLHATFWEINCVNILEELTNDNGGGGEEGGVDAEAMKKKTLGFNLSFAYHFTI